MLKINSLFDALIVEYAMLMRFFLKPFQRMFIQNLSFKTAVKQKNFFSSFYDFKSYVSSVFYHQVYSHFSILFYAPKHKKKFNFCVNSFERIQQWIGVNKLKSRSNRIAFRSEKLFPNTIIQQDILTANPVLFSDSFSLIDCGVIYPMANRANDTVSRAMVRKVRSTNLHSNGLSADSISDIMRTTNLKNSSISGQTEGVMAGTEAICGQLEPRNFLGTFRQNQLALYANLLYANQNFFMRHNSLRCDFLSLIFSQCLKNIVVSISRLFRRVYLHIPFLHESFLQFLKLKNTCIPASYRYTLFFFQPKQVLWRFKKDDLSYFYTSVIFPPSPFETLESIVAHYFNAAVVFITNNLKLLVHHYYGLKIFLSFFNILKYNFFLFYTEKNISIAVIFSPFTKGVLPSILKKNPFFPRAMKFLVLRWL